MEAGTYRIIIIIIINIILNFEFASHVPVWHCPPNSPSLPPCPPFSIDVLEACHIKHGSRPWNHKSLALFLCENAIVVRRAMQYSAECHIYDPHSPLPQSIADQSRLEHVEFPPSLPEGASFRRRSWWIERQTRQEGQAIQFQVWGEMLASSNECVCDRVLKVAMKGGPHTVSRDIWCLLELALN